MRFVGDVRTPKTYKLPLRVQVEVDAAAVKLGEYVYEFVERALEHELRRARKRHNDGRRFRKTDSPQRGRRRGGV